jgi:hypothetical protein
MVIGAADSNFWSLLRGPNAGDWVHPEGQKDMVSDGKVSLEIEGFTPRS